MAGPLDFLKYLNFGGSIGGEAPAQGGPVGVQLRPKMPEPQTVVPWDVQHLSDHDTDLTNMGMAGLPVPPIPTHNYPEPYRAGDPVLDRRDMTASTNHIPGMSHTESAGMSRGITMREDRDRWLSGPAYKGLVENLIRQGQDQHKKRLIEPY